MLKFFRRIRRSLIKSGAARKYFLYAIGEIALVVIGILIALQINNWNEYKKDRQKEYILLKQLKDEYVSNRNAITVGLEEYQNQLDLLDLQLDYTGPHVSVPDKKTLDTISHIPTISIELVYNTISPVLSNDQLGLLESEELKRQLSSFPGSMNRYKYFEKQVQDLTLKRRTIHMKYTAVLSIGDRIDPTLSSYKFDPKKKARIIHDSDYLGWLRDREYQNVLVDHIWQMQFALDVLRDLQQHNEEILMLLARELER